MVLEIEEVLETLKILDTSRSIGDLKMSWKFEKKTLETWKSLGDIKNLEDLKKSWGHKNDFVYRRFEYF